MQTLYLYHATTCQYIGQRSFKDDQPAYVEDGQGSTATPGPEGQTLSEDYIWDGNTWRLSRTQ